MIFLDVDDTLVLYEDGRRTGTAPRQVHPHGIFRGERFTVNHWLVERVLAHPEETLVVWSGGGRDYARLIVEQYIPTLAHARFLIKDESTRHLISPRDVVMDDLLSMRSLAVNAGAIGVGPHEDWNTDGAS